MEPTTTKETGPTPFETLNGKTTIQVKFTTKETATVDVLQLPIKLFQKLLEVQNDESARIELYTGKAPGWSDTLTVESALLVLEEGQRVNADFFARWVKLRIDVQKSLQFAAGTTETPPAEPKISRSGSLRQLSPAG